MNTLNTSQTTWNLGLIFNGDDDPKINATRAEVETKSYAFINKWKDRTDYLEKPEVLAEALKEYEEWAKNLGPYLAEDYYFSLKSFLDQSDTDLKAKLNKLHDLSTKITNDMQFFFHRVSKIPVEKQKTFIEYPELKEYRHILQKAFEESKYLLSEDVEKVLNLKEATSRHNWIRMVSTFISKEERKALTDEGKIEVKTFEELMDLLHSPKQEVRDSAAKAINYILSKHVEIAENELNSVLQDKKVDDELRGFTRPDKQRHLDDDIDTEVVDALINAVASRFKISHDYFKLKAQLIGVDKLKYYDKFFEYGSLDMNFDYPEAANKVYSVMNKLDKDFGDIFEKYVSEGNFDVYPRKGKYGGGFCINVGPNFPTYILLNHTNSFDSIRTLAHETGHGINAELTCKKQNALNIEVGMATAEVASTFFEDFVLDDITTTANDEMRLTIMMHRLNNSISAIQTQVACYNFEQELHTAYRKAGHLSHEEIGKIFAKNMKRYIGPSVKKTKGTENWWIYWSHIRQFFYVYSYASGLLISKSLQASVKENPAFIEKVKEFLSAGTSDSPKNIFAKMGIDITDSNFWNKGLDEQEKLLKETRALAVKLGKIPA